MARERGLVANQQMPVETRGDREGAARTADSKILPYLCLRRPRRGRSRLMQRELDIELACFAVISARSEVACDWPRLVVREHRAIRAGRGHDRLVGSGRRKEDLDVIVEGRGFKVVEIVAA